MAWRKWRESEHRVAWRKWREPEDCVMEKVEGARALCGVEKVEGARAPCGMEKVEGARGPCGMEKVEGARGACGLEKVEGARGRVAWRKWREPEDVWPGESGGSQRTCGLEKACLSCCSHLPCCPTGLNCLRNIQDMDNYKEMPTNQVNL